MKTKHLVLSVAAVVMIVLLLVVSIYNAQSAKASSRQTQIAYPVTLPSMSLVGISADCDGTVDGRRNTLAALWTTFGETKEFNDDPAIYRKKIYVVFYNHSPGVRTGYSIFIGYTTISWLRNELVINNKSVVVMDFPKGNYYALDARGTSANSIIKAWGDLYNSYPNDVSNLALEAYTLDSDSYSVQNVTIYLKKK